MKKTGSCGRHYSKLQQLKFVDSLHAVIFGEGSNNIIMESVDAKTRKEAIMLSAGYAPVMGRDSGIYNSIFCRLRTQTQGAAAVSLMAEELWNVVLRDLTDETTAPGYSVVLGKSSDMTVRGVRSNRVAVITTDVCDGLFLSNLQCGGTPLTRQKSNTRSYLEEKIGY